MLTLSRLWIPFLLLLWLSPAVADEPPPLMEATGAKILEDLREKPAQVTLLNVWAVWCQPCREEMPGLLELREEYADQGVVIQLVSVDFDTEREKTLGFLTAMGVDFPTYFRTGDDDEAFIASLYEGWSGSLPATFLFDSKGKLVQFWEGDASRDFFESRILEVLQQRPGPPETQVKSP